MQKLAYTILCCYFFAIHTQAQTKDSDVKLIRTAVYYTFKGADNIEEVNALKEEIQTHKGVKEIKTVFKTEKNLAQLIVVFEDELAVTELESSKDGVDKTFIKDILLKHKYTTTDLFYENLPTE